MRGSADFGNDALSWISEVQCDCLKKAELAAPHCVSLRKVKFHMACSQRFNSVKVAE